MIFGIADIFDAVKGAAGFCEGQHCVRHIGCGLHPFELLERIVGPAGAGKTTRLRRVKRGAEIGVVFIAGQIEQAGDDFRRAVRMRPEIVARIVADQKAFGADQMFAFEGFFRIGEAAVDGGAEFLKKKY